MSRGTEADPAEIYGDKYKTDNRGQQLSMNKAAVKQPKPFGAEGRKVEVKEVDNYEDDLEEKMDRMLNRNKTTKQQDAKAKVKSSCGACGQAITEDDKWVHALNRDFHRKCFSCSDCKQNMSQGKYFEHGDHAVCEKCQIASQAKCPKCHEAILPEQAALKALEGTWHASCFECASCHKKLGTDSSRTFREKAGSPYCEDCFAKK